MAPEPLPAGTIVNERYHLERKLGQGGFGITYLAADAEREDRCVVKELAPEGARRGDGGRIELAELGAAAALRLRRQFLQEAETLRSLRAAGVPAVRDAFQENGTAYYVTTYLEGAVSLDRLVGSEGRLDEPGALRVLHQVLDTLATVHGRGLLHRDLKPTNLLVAPDGRAHLIDFGSARVWHADLAVEHTVQFTPGFAPIEQMSARARRGPATDFYGLCATLYWALTGSVPPSAADRAAGVALPPLRGKRPDVSAGLASAIEAGLMLRYEERPATVEAFRRLLEPEPGTCQADDLLQRLDAKRVALQRMRPGRRECPACGGLLDEARPLRSGVCPVCHEGRLRERKMSDRLCPVCRAGALRHVLNRGPLAWCPACQTGRLRTRVGLPWSTRRFVCLACAAQYAVTRGQVRREGDEEVRSWDALRLESGRSESTWQCDACAAQFDDLGDGRRIQIVPQPKRWRALYPEEWARVAANLDPGAGNLACDACEAEFFADAETCTPLAASADPFGFLAAYQGRPLHREDVPWLGVGKSSAAPGLLCRACGSEFDHTVDGQLSLVWTEHDVLRHHVGGQGDVEGWRRVALELPLPGHEGELDAALAEAVRASFREGAMPFDSRNPAVTWSGPAMRYEPDGDLLVQRQEGTLTVTLDEITYGGTLRKTRVPRGDVMEVAMHDGLLLLRLTSGDLWFEVGEVELHARLDSGRVAIPLGAEDLVARLTP